MKSKINLPLSFSLFLLLCCFSWDANAQSSTAASITRGKTIYIQRCMACHQQDGGGVPHMNPPLDGASAVKGKDKSKLIRVILKGMSDRVEIDGEFYSNNMAGHADLTNQQVADVLTYIRNSWSNLAGAVTAAEVKTVRAKIK
ncbi:MAG: c-type cytochrome [Bacteroidota bacterium]